VIDKKTVFELRTHAQLLVDDAKGLKQLAEAITNEWLLERLSTGLVKQGLTYLEFVEKRVAVLRSVLQEMLRALESSS
jgi:hypothetical protein